MNLEKVIDANHDYLKERRRHWKLSEEVFSVI